MRHASIMVHMRNRWGILGENRDLLDRQKLGRYRLLQQVAQGGMGEVYRAFDEQTSRYVALKRIRESLLKSKAARRRFLHEAKLTASLNHPSIVPIFDISRQGSLDYYTMPFIQGQTLKESLRQMKQRREDLHIMASARIFTSVCQAVAHAHTSGILHRDLKAENIMLGQHEQVLILDWGLACWKGSIGFQEEPFPQFEELSADKTIDESTGQTNPGKIVGTLAYMAPERLVGPATEKSDIYSLGILLYLILTYQLPFKRKSAREFRKNPTEIALDPRKLAPHRDIPEMLVRIIQRAMHPDPNHRYDSAQALVADLQIFLEGRSSWYLLKRFDPDDPVHWAQQELVFIDRWPSEIALTLQACWVYWMVSKPTHSGNFRIDFAFTMQEDAQGLGLLINLPDVHEQIEPLGGFCLWIAGPAKGGAFLCRDGSVLVDAPHILPKVGQRHTLTVEKIDNRLYCAFDYVPVITYVSTLPLVGAQIGLLRAGGDAKIESLDFFAGGLSLKISCLTVPDHFLAAKIYARALAEYRRIAAFFSGHSEGQKARFLAGITLLEMARDCPLKREKSLHFQCALDEFQQLRDSPSAPLEWLGKALTYRYWNQWNEEANCLELGCLRYPDNPKKKYLREEIISQLFAAVGKNRQFAVRLILLLARSLPEDLLRSDTSAQVYSLRSHLDLPAYFLDVSDRVTREDSSTHRWQLVLEMSYWLGLPQAMIDSVRSLRNVDDRVFFEIYNAVRHIGMSHALSLKWLSHLVDDSSKLPNFQIEEVLFTSRKGRKDWCRSELFIKEQDLSDHSTKTRVLRGLYWSALKHLHRGNYSSAEVRANFVRAHWPLEGQLWQWREVRGLIALARKDPRGVLATLDDKEFSMSYQQENHPLFLLYASAALVDERTVGNAVWNCAQFARRVSVRLAANCIGALQAIEEGKTSGENPWQKSKDLANHAFYPEKDRVYRLLIALSRGLDLPLSLSNIGFLLPKRH